MSAAYGLSTFEPSADISGSTAHAIELVFAPLEEHAEVVRRDGPTVILRRKSESPHDLDVLASTLRFAGLSKATVEDDEIHAQFESDVVARAFVEAGMGTFDVGPYELERQVKGRVILSRRGARRDRLEIVEVPVGQQWRRLLAHDIDVVPNTAEIHRSQFSGMASVRTIDLPVKTAMALAMNTKDKGLASADVRRRLAAVLERDPIANLVCGDAGCAADYWDTSPPQSQVVLPPELELLIFTGDASFARVARAVRHQLRAFGCTVTIRPVALSELRSRHARGAYQLALIPIPASRAGALKQMRWFYPDEELKAALAANDEAAALARLRDQVPVVTLYEVREFAAVDRRFCGGNPTSSLSWRWLADLELCEGSR